MQLQPQNICCKSSSWGSIYSNDCQFMTTILSQNEPAETEKSQTAILVPCVRNRTDRPSVKKRSQRPPRTEPTLEILTLFVLRKFILQIRMRSHPVALDVWFLVWLFVYFHSSCVRTAKALLRLGGCAGSPEPSLVACAKSTITSWAGSVGPHQANLVLIAYASSESRETFRQKARSLAPLNVWACTVKICHDGMLEDTNSLDGAQLILSMHWRWSSNVESTTVAFFCTAKQWTLLKKERI